MLVLVLVLVKAHTRSEAESTGLHLASKGDSANIIVPLMPGGHLLVSGSIKRGSKRLKRLAGYSHFVKAMPIQLCAIALVLWPNSPLQG